MIRHKLITFIAAMGIPISSVTSSAGGCTGVCGSCQLSCVPGVVALLILLVKVLKKKVVQRFRTGDAQ